MTADQITVSDLRKGDVYTHLGAHQGHGGVEFTHTFKNIMGSRTLMFRCLGCGDVVAERDTTKIARM